jgi:hypothetical protein
VAATSNFSYALAWERLAIDPDLTFSVEHPERERIETTRSEAPFFIAHHPREQWPRRCHEGIAAVQSVLL